MRSPFIPLAIVVFALACADTPTAPSLIPGEPRLADYPPPPWAEVFGDITTDGGALSIAPLMSRSAPAGPRATHVGAPTATYIGWLLVSPGDHAAILRFADGGTNVTFSNGARIMKVNGKVSGHGTMTVGGHTYELSLVDEFEANGDCAATAWDYDGPSCASFSAEDGSFSSEGSVWTGILSNDGGGGEFDFPPGWDNCKRGGCVCVNCEIIVTSDTKGKVR